MHYPQALTKILTITPIWIISPRTLYQGVKQTDLQVLKIHTHHSASSLPSNQDCQDDDEAYGFIDFTPMNQVNQNHNRGYV